MLRAMFVLLAVSSIGLAQTSSDGSFSVRHFKKANFSLSQDDMRQAESIYRSACAVVQSDFRGGIGELHPHFTVVIGTDHDEIFSRRAEADEIWLKKWDPVVFAQGVVFLAFDQMLTSDVLLQLSNRAVRQSKAAVAVSGLATH